MTKSVLCDNDAVLKSCCCDISIEVLLCLKRIGTTFVLGTARYVIGDRLARSNRIAYREVAKANFCVFISSVKEVEPTDEEIQLAAEFETEAQKRNVDLDGGESLLVAILIRRDARVLLTGDKRAIVGIETLGTTLTTKTGRRLACLEQLFLSLLNYEDLKKIQCRVCREAKTDIALSNCFSCTSGKYSRESVSDGLKSYVTSLRDAAPSVLLTSTDLSCVVP